MPPEQAGDARPHKIGRRVLPLARRRDRRAARRGRRRSSSCGSASSRTATRRTIRSRSSPARTCCTSRGRSRTSPRRPAGASDEVVDVLNRARLQTVRGARRAAASASRRQGADGVERPDDRGVRARRARAARAGHRRGDAAASPYLDGRAARGVVSCASAMWNAGSRHAAAPLPRRARPASTAYAEDYAYLIFGLLELFQADRDPAWLEWAHRAPAAAGRAVLGRGRRRLVQHDRARSDRAAAHEGGLRRRRADGQLGVGAEPPDAVAPGRPTRRGAARIERTLRLFGARLEQMGRAVPMMAAALSAYTAGLQQIVVVGEGDERRGAPRRRCGGVPAVCDRAPADAEPRSGAGASRAVPGGDAPGGRRTGRVRVPRLHLPCASHHAGGAGSRTGQRVSSSLTSTD